MMNRADLNYVELNRGMMKKLFFVLLILLGFTGTQAWAAAIRLQDLHGEVQIQKAGGKSWTAAEEGSALVAGDRVKVGKRSSVNLVMEYGTLISLGEKTEFGVKRYDLEENIMKANLELALGKPKAKVGKLKKGSEFQVRTPTAVAAVRGTLFDLWVLKELGEYLSKLKVWEGIVEFCNAQGADCEDIKEGKESSKGQDDSDDHEEDDVYDQDEVDGLDEDSEGSQDDFEEEQEEEQHHDDFSNL